VGRNLNALAARVHEANQRWWHDLTTGERLQRNVNEMLMLVVSELAEAMEGHRKGLMDDKLPHRTMPEVELADAYIRLLDLAGAYAIDLDQWRGRTPKFTDNFAENLYLITRELSYHHETHKTGLGCLVMDGIYSILVLSGLCGYDIDAAFEEKMAYNATRHDHTREGRLAAGGKKY
jgi:hypothetical protein